MFKAAIALLAVALIAVAGLYWDRGRIVDKLEATQVQLKAVELDAAFKSETIDVLRIHSRQLDELRQIQSATENEIRNTEGFDDATPAIILDAICSSGLC